MSALEDDAVSAQAQAAASVPVQLEGLAADGPGLAAEELAPGRVRGQGRTRIMPTGWRQVALVGTMTIFGGLCIDTYLPALPQINQELHASASAVQLTLTACLIGILAGQIMIGPVSDSLGRRGPLIAGLMAFVLSSMACAIAPNIYALIAFRLIQGFGGAAGIVIARSIVRDLYSGVALARFFSTLMLATGLGPLLAPQIGSWIMLFTNWRGVFGALAVFGMLLLISVWHRVPETLPPDKRIAGSIVSMLKTMVSVTRDRTFIGYVLACALSLGAGFAYISASSFVLQNIYRLSPLGYGLVFALNACGLIAGSQINGRLTGRYGASRLLSVGLAIQVVSGVLLYIVVSTHTMGLGGVIPSLFILMVGWGFVGPSTTALAMQRYPHAAGSASAVLGGCQFGLAAVIAPLAGTAGTSDATPMITLILALSVAAVASRLFLAGRPNPASPVGLPTAPAAPCPRCSGSCTCS